jgi:hypothetical protein
VFEQAKTVQDSDRAATVIGIHMEQLVEWKLAGETKVIWESSLRCHFVQYKSHMRCCFLWLNNS